VDEWLDELADALGEDRVPPREAGALLKLSREVAHGVERKLAPLASYLAGVHVGRSTAEGLDRETALGEFLERARAMIPEQPSEPDGAGPEGDRSGG
jgi:hypothetical protein